MLNVYILWPQIRFELPIVIHSCFLFFTRIAERYHISFIEFHPTKLPAPFSFLTTAYEKPQERSASGCEASGIIDSRSQQVKGQSNSCNKFICMKAENGESLKLIKTMIREIWIFERSLRLCRIVEVVNHRNLYQRGSNCKRFLIKK